MARRDEAWLKNYEDVEFEVAGLGGDETGSGSPTERHPMLPPKTHLKDESTGTGWNGSEMGSLARDGQPHIAGVKPSGSLATHPTLAPPGTVIPVARIPRSHSAPKVLPNSPLNPSTTTTTPTSNMPFPSPFAHTRPPSRGSAYFSRIASEEARAFGTNLLPSTNSSSANQGLTSRGSMILYRVADPFSPPPSLPSANNSGANTPTSHYSLKGLVATDDGTLPLPDPTTRNRLSMYSTSGDSIVSLSSDSKYPNFESQRSGLVAYVYDPETEDLDDEDVIDWLHDPETLIAEKLVKLRNRPPPHRPAYLRAPTESSFSWRGLLNITVLILLISTVLALFIAYPTVATLNSEERNKAIAFNTKINSTGQANDAAADPAQDGGGTTTSLTLSTATTDSSTTTTSSTSRIRPATTPTTTSTPTSTPTSTSTPLATLSPTISEPLDPSTSASTSPGVFERRRTYGEDNGRRWAVKKNSGARRSSRDVAAAW